MTNTKFFIPLNVPSAKNELKFNFKTKSAYYPKNCQEYAKGSKDYYKVYASSFYSHAGKLPKPLLVSFQLIRKDKRIFDYLNPIQTVQDAMVKYHWFPDDNYKIMIPIILPVQFNSDKYGVEIGLISNEEEFQELITKPLVNILKQPKTDDLFI